MTTLYVYTENDLNRFVAPRLLTAPTEYDPRFMDQYTNVLRLYFNQLDSFNNQLRTTTVSPEDEGTNIYFPNGSFSSAVSQTAAVANTAYNVTFDTTELSRDISLVGGYQIVTAKSGRYNFQFSAQAANADNATQTIDIWFHKNGNDVPRSNTRIGMAQRKSAGIPFYAVATVNVLLDMAAGDNMSLQWSTTNTLATLAAEAAGGSPTHPAIPSVILTATFVSKI